MDKRLTIALLALACSLSPLWGDSIDDAEAKRRGVSVSQIQAESALAKEKQRTAALEKQVADLQKQLADLQKGPAANTEKPPAGAPASAPVSAARTSTPAATTPRPGSSGPAVDFDGSRARSPLYDDLVKRYMSGDWTNLAADLAAKEKEIAALPAGYLADLTYIKQTVAECRPAWWDDIKNGKTNKFAQAVFKQPLSVHFQTAPTVRAKGFNNTGGQLILNIEWPNAEMDSRAPMDMHEIDMVSNSKHAFVHADALNENIWIQLGAMACFARVGAEKLNKLSPDVNDQLNRYAHLMGYVTAGYYGPPTTRRLVFFSGGCSLKSNVDHDRWRNVRPIGAAFLIDMTLHSGQYPTLINPNVFYMDDGVKEYEYSHISYAVDRLLESPLTLAEDRRLRDILKKLAETNTNWENSKIVLPNKLSFDLDLEKEAASTAERIEFLKKNEP